MQLRKNAAIVSVTIFTVMLFLIGCAKKEKTASLLTILSVSGTAEVIRGDQRIPLEKEFGILNDDIVLTGGDGTVSIFAGKRRIIYLNRNTRAKLIYAKNEENSGLQITLNLENGEMFSESISSENIGTVYTVSTPAATVEGNRSSFATRFHAKKGIAIVSVFEKAVIVSPANGEQVEVPECQKVLVQKDEAVSKFVSISEKDVDELKGWVDAGRVQSLVEASACFGATEEKQDLPPVWKGKPKKQCKPNALFTDAMSAQDPEGGVVRYYLLKGPAGLTVSEESGKIQYTPRKPGTFEISISAEDESGNASARKYYLTVLGSLTLFLEYRETIKADEQFFMDASRSVDGTGKRSGLLYRFDINSDGKWDFPASGDFGTQSKYPFTIKKTGEHRITVEVKDGEDNSASASKTIEVTIPPQITISFTPQYGTVGAEYTISVSQPGTKNKPREKLAVRWDLNGDGKWDYPADGSFNDELKIQHVWDKSGIHRVTVEAEDNNRNRITAAKEIKVYQGVAIQELKGPDTVNINENITATCIAKDPDFAVVEYAWDFAGVGMVSKKSKKPTIQFSYKEAGKYTLVCSVINEKGMRDSESREIIVLNFATTIDAGGPYKANVKVPFSVEGLAKDADNTIALYLWDFDNDKKFEWQSEKTAKTKHTFSKKGTYVIRFGAKLDDGTVVQDTAKVLVGNRPPKAFAGADILSRRGRKVKLNGIGKDADGNIVKYEWALAGDGKFSYSSKDTGFVEHSFETYTSAILKVTDSEGAFATDTINIIICPKGMELFEEGKFCIDVYEWPNKKKALPTRQVTYNEAVNACKKAGKRLCSAKELKSVCKGNRKSYDYPYGRKYEQERCNTYGNRHIKNSVAKSGEFPECVSRDGIFDMSGNVAEWTSTGNGAFQYVAGGWWQNGEKRTKCDSYVPIKKNKKYFHVGFRCCK